MKNFKFLNLIILIMCSINTYSNWDFDPKRGYGDLDDSSAYECYRFDGKPCDDDPKLDISEDINVIMNQVLNGNEEILEQYSSNELRILRNTIYAKNGYLFKSKDLRDYFSQKSWYNGHISNESEIPLSSDEKKFIDIVKSYE